jgi:hypothetical protein
VHSEQLYGRSWVDLSGRPYRRPRSRKAENELALTAAITNLRS